MPPAKTPPSRSILIVDPDKDSAEAVAKLLRDMGSDVEIAHDGPSALELERTFRPEIAIIHLGLKGMDAYTLARFLRAGPQRKVTLVSSADMTHARDDNREEKAGFRCHLTRPTSVSDLRRMLIDLDAAVPKSSPDSFGPAVGSETAPAEGSAKPLNQLPPHRILVVNDCQPHAKELAAQLRKAGHTVEIAYDGQSALDLERTFRPEMVIIELALTGMDAFAVARSLRAQSNRDLMLVSVTYGDTDCDNAEWEACFDDHMNKLHSIPLLMRGRMKLADISPEDWMLDHRDLSREGLTLELLLATTAREFEPQFAPDELAPLIPDEVLREIRKFAEPPNDLADSFTPGAWSKHQRAIIEGASRWSRFFNP
jgi:CheY-like chemotaxis protein